MQQKHHQLEAILSGMGSVAVALSGGVDSGLVAKVAHDCLGEAAIAVTAVSPSLAAEERDAVASLVERIGIRHVFLDSYETEDPRYQANAPDRCYFLQDQRVRRADRVRGRRGLSCPGRWHQRRRRGRSPARPARRPRTGRAQPAAGGGDHQGGGARHGQGVGAADLGQTGGGVPGIAHPLRRAGDRREARQVERAEAVLRELGIRQLRVRHHDQVARLEVEPDAIATVLKHRGEITEQLKRVGFVYVTLDLDGFRSGSMNEVLP